MSEGGFLGFTAKHFDIIRWCGLECQRQQSGERSVVWMVSAWDYAWRKRSAWPRERDILVMAQVIEPHKNANGYRNTPVTAGANVKLAPRLIVPAMDSLFDAILTTGRITPSEAYREFEEIHPFIDGNGRVGAILYNWLRSTLHDPVIPPDFWAHQRNEMEGTLS